MTGWRIGYIGAPELIAKACNKMQGQITSGANCIAQRATITALNTPISEIKYMIDEFYDRNVKVIISADSSIDKLCNIKKINKDFERTKSRLNEMQSSDYMKKEHKQ